MPSLICIDVQCNYCGYHDDRVVRREDAKAIGEVIAACAELNCIGRLIRLPSAPAIPPNGFILLRSNERTQFIRSELQKHRLEYAAKDGETGAVEDFVDVLKHEQKKKEGNGL